MITHVYPDRDKRNQKAKAKRRLSQSRKERKGDLESISFFGLKPKAKRGLRFS